MKGDKATCIYCYVRFDPSKGEGDHVIPRAFGDFRNPIIFRGACPSCNNKLSPLEEELLRTAPEAVMRRYAGATESRKGQPTGWKGASGVPQPKFIIKHEDHDELIDASSQVGGEAKPIDQLVIVLSDDSNTHIKLFPSMSAQAIRRKLDQRGISDSDIVRVHWHSDEKYVEPYKAMLKELWPQLEQGESPSVEAGIHKVPVRIECKFTQKYYRAIAKIAFHYLLACTKCGFTGHENAFIPVREFIINGGDQNHFFQNTEPKIALPVGVLGNGQAVLPARWMHMLCCFESPSSAVVAVYTLFGPQRPPSPHFVTLIQDKPLPDITEHRYGHVFIYGNPDLGDTETAFVKPVQINKHTPDKHM